MGCALRKEKHEMKIISPNKSKRESNGQSVLNVETRLIKIKTTNQLVFQPSLFVGHRKENIENNYIFEKIINSDHTGLVRLASHKISGQKRAIKTIQKDTISNDMKLRARFFTEVDILRSADHPNIIRLYEFYEDITHFHLVTEYVPGGELFDYIIKSKMLSEPIAAHFMRQLLSAVAYCHSNNIVHRDLKPENLLIDVQSVGATLKVIDFGLSAFLESSKEKLTKKFGTSYYMAPEVLRKDYNEKCDIWSCGVILYILLSGKQPFNGISSRQIVRRVQQGQFSFNGHA